MPLTISLIIDDDNWRALLPRARSLAVKSVTAALAHEKWAKKNVVINVTLASDAMVKKLNRDWRGKDKPTNVLSFPVEEPGMPVPRGRARMLGDIILARQTLVREAKSEGKKLAHHYQHLLVHGTLHLLGYDHLVDDEAEEMEAREVKILAKLGVPDPYADPDSTKPAKPLK